MSSVCSVVGNGLFVPKEKIAANGDYNLSGERYREGVVAVSSWPFVRVGDAFRKGDQTVLPESLGGPVTYLGLENITQNTGEIEGSVVTEKPADIKSLKNVFKPRDILYGKLRPNLNKVWLADRKGICSTDIFVIEAIEGTTDPALYAYLFRSARFNDAVMGQLKGAQLPRIGWSSFAELQIPLPPLDVQNEIVAEIEGYQKVINGARAVLDHYRPHNPIHPDWPMKKIGELVTINNGFVLTELPDHGTVACVKVSDMNLAENQREIVTSSHWLENTTKSLLPVNSVIFPKRGAAIATNKKRITRIPCLIDNNCMGLTVRSNAELVPEYLFYFLLGFDLSSISNSAGIALINNGDIASVEIPLPPLATQQAIVADIQVEQELVAANRELIARLEKKIQATLARVWGEDAEHGCTG